MPLIVGLSTGPIYGVPDYTPVADTIGAGMSSEYEQGGEVEELKNGDSEIIAAAYHSDKNTLSYSFKIRGTFPTDPRGTALTIDGVTGYLDKLTRTKNEGAFAEGRIEITEYPDFA